MLMKKKSIIAGILTIVLAGVGVLIQQVAFARETTTFRFAAVERGDMESVVSATGTLNAVTTVAVGTQVSGQVSDLLVDFNDQVKKGQLMARIDPTLALQAVTDAQANLEKAQAQSLQASRDQSRNKELAASGLVALSAVEQTESTYSVARATVKSAQVALDRAKQNLSYTNIYAPIDGVVVERNVSDGQTVAASLSAPQLFLIAGDLSHMQILALVSESDIEQIKVGQAVRFTVQALPGQTFNGSVQQVRLQSQTADNVVNYTVVVDVANPDGKLLPGMTARADFLVKSASKVLRVSNAALRFKPTDEMLAELGDPNAAAKTAKTVTTTTTTTVTGTNAATGTGAARTRSGNGQRTGGARTGGMGTLYSIDAKGKLQVTRVRTGISDGTFTEVQGKTVTEGMKVIAGTVQPSTAKTASTTTAPSSPFQGSSQPQQRGGGGRPPAGGGF
jgi:HlyD family secretion protein